MVFLDDRFHFAVSLFNSFLSTEAFHASFSFLLLCLSSSDVLSHCGSYQIRVSSCLCTRTCISTRLHNIIILFSFTKPPMDAVFVCQKQRPWEHNSLYERNSKRHGLWTELPWRRGLARRLRSILGLYFVKSFSRHRSISTTVLSVTGCQCWIDYG